MDSIKWYKSPDMIVALSALLIGLVTAFTSIYSAYIDREYAKSSVWPRLEIFRSVNPNSSFSYGVSNNGTGPALIKYAKIKYGTKYIKTWSEIEAFQNIIQSHISNRTLSPQKGVTPVSYKGEKVKDLLKADTQIKIELCYCSIYEECWLIDKSNTPSPVKACYIDDDEIFLQ
ncbi:hypothetical protein Q4530_09510 [Colwellia sp. 1_MG-2023]|jgi:hypothetical protein|uniref:hypothetical protein n=1 Tax=unclassified Colwellia TaxID=196834 RepID=UPI001C07F303|nr:MULTISPECIES: hypothetical protein [unclassified Colwellia]MBU2925841.1 hypothetical protein [Colwellia sp. C2M11]MDO6652762.1 hypothetical protein [Colwellia sp. 3_MG-2023]MDO6665636.1 hypothetical protein [Colwellia sp. 2_MG-2023]MDO6690009.1 hypothetical protein [Colwellia sp. 1_MG-2023]